MEESKKRERRCQPVTRPTSLQHRESDESTNNQLHQRDKVVPRINPGVKVRKKSLPFFVNMYWNILRIIIVSHPCMFPMSFCLNDPLSQTELPTPVRVTHHPVTLCMRVASTFTFINVGFSEPSHCCLLQSAIDAVFSFALSAKTVTPQLEFVRNKYLSILTLSIHNQIFFHILLVCALSTRTCSRPALSVSSPSIIPKCSCD